MKIITSLLLGTSLLLSTATFAQKSKDKTAAPADTKKSVKTSPETVYTILTTMGTIKVKLYNETPLHRDNFIKLAEQKFYDSLLFHRVIGSFMVQGGDPQSKLATPDAMLGNGDAGYTVPAEINNMYFHKKGALAAARQGDDVNPTKASSGCQFYIVQGKTYTEQEIVGMENNLGQRKKQELFQAYAANPANKTQMDSLQAYQKTGQTEKMNKLIAEVLEPAINAEYAKNPYKLADEQRKAYTTVGGTPHLDGGYTVYGEVIEGLDVVDKISAVEKGMNDRPKVDVRIISIRKVGKK
ncbi:MAG: peptidylprolyl isomerase [Bacteroidia bacterium]|nr:peptidylprolyl isomerase [Bacteroidia bacterium]